MNDHAAPMPLTELGRLLDRHGLGHITLAQLTGGVFLTGYLLALGSSEFLIGVVAALPLMAKLSQLYTSWRIERKGHWAELTRRGALFGRLPLLLAAAIPLIGLPDRPAALLLAVTIGMAAMGGSIFEIGFLTWMAEMVPASKRGEFWGKRVRATEFFGVMVALTAAFLFDQWRNANPDSLDGYMILFAVGAVAGIGVVPFLHRIPSPKREHHKPEPASLIETLMRPTRDPNFRALLSFVGSWGFAVGLLGPFSTVYMLQELGLSFLMTTGFNVVQVGVMALTQVYWGRLSDHFGCKPVIWIATIIITVLPLLWASTTIDRVWPILPAQILSGFGWAAYNISMSNLVLKLAPERSRSSYVASLGAVYAVAQSLAPLVGGALISLLKETGTNAFTAYYILFGSSFVIRAGSMPLLRRVTEPGGAAVSHMIRVMGRFRSMSAPLGTDFLFDYAYTHFARAADFVAGERRKKGEGRETKGRKKEKGKDE